MLVEPAGWVTVKVCAADGAADSTSAVHAYRSLFIIYVFRERFAEHELGGAAILPRSRTSVARVAIERHTIPQSYRPTPQECAVAAHVERVRRAAGTRGRDHRDTWRAGRD